MLTSKLFVGFNKNHTNLQQNSPYILCNITKPAVYPGGFYVHYKIFRFNFSHITIIITVIPLIYAGSSDALI